MMGLLVNYRWCDGCHSCELACQMANELPPEQFGIKLCQVGPWEYGDGKWEYTYIPAITDQCNLCGERQAQGKLPACVQHCQANCLQIVDAHEGGEIASRNSKTLFMTV
ncbi:MAG: hypothetical protein ACOYIK_05955 [Coriobacteriales bacterium]|jgi:Fe-S-cluster-containing dehydrogenase component